MSNGRSNRRVRRLALLVILLLAYYGFLNLMREWRTIQRRSTDQQGEQ